MAKVISDNRGGSTAYVIEGGSREEIEDAIDRIEHAYHPLGYGTSFTPPEQRADGSWICRGSRLNSCD